MPVVDFCQLKQDRRPGLRVWSGRNHAANHNYALHETVDNYGNPIFDLSEDARHLINLRERDGGYGRPNHLIGGEHWRVWRVEIRDMGAVFLTCEDFGGDYETGSAAEAAANHIDRDRSTGIPLPLNGNGVRF